MEPTRNYFDKDKLNNFMSNLKSMSLPGYEAHLQLTPYRSKPSSYDSSQARQGAVAVIIQNHEQPSIILTKRAGYAGVHGGQISFPGGKMEQEDGTLLKTAIRETFEEIGIELLEHEFIHPLSEIYIPPSNFNVSPFLFYTENVPTYQLNNEVDYIIDLNIEEFVNEPIVAHTIKLHDGMVIKNAPCFQYKGEIIWGATAAILNELRWVFSGGGSLQ